MSTELSQYNTFSLPGIKSQSLDLKNTINKYLYHWPLFVIGLLLTLTSAFVYLQKSLPLYEIKATLLIKDEKKTSDQQSAFSQIDPLNSSKIIENEIEVLKSKQIIEQVVKDLNLWVFYQKKEGIVNYDLYQSTPVKLTLSKFSGNYNEAPINLVIKDNKSFLLIMPNGKLKEFFFGESIKNNIGIWKLKPTQNLSQFKGSTINISLVDPEKLVLGYQKAIDVSLSNKLATAIVLSLKDQVPQRGKDILNRLIFDYNAAASLEKIRETKSTLDFLDQRIASLGGELTEAEKDIESFKSIRGLTDISDDSKIKLENMQASDTRLNEVNVQLSVIESIENYINSARNFEKAPATIGITDPALSSLIEKLASLQLQRERLLATTPETNPDFEPINRQLAATRAAIKESIRNIKSSLISTKDKLQFFNNRFESTIKSIPTQERQLVSIKRQQAIKENLYNYLLQKREEVSVSYASILTNDRIIDQAYAIPPDNTKKPITYAIAFLLGLTIPTSFIFARNSIFDDKIISSDEISESVKIPIIAELTFEPTPNTLVINDTNTTPLSEQFRGLRTKLYYLYGQKEHGRVTLLTSSIVSEGKSFVTSNLAWSLACADRKTIILEMDLRRPKIADVFHLTKNYLGISDFLKGKLPITDVIRNSGYHPNLDIISSGSTIKNPSELLEKKQLKELILNLRNIYDDIIIDSPPVHLVPDAMILSRLTDQTLYVIRQGFTKKSELNFIREIDQQKALPNINIIFNGIERIKYGYGYQYNTNYYNLIKKNKSITSIFSDFSGRF